MGFFLMDLAAVEFKRRKRGTDGTSTDGVMHQVCAPRNKPRSKAPFKSRGLHWSHIATIEFACCWSDLFIALNHTEFGGG